MSSPSTLAPDAAVVATSMDHWSNDDVCAWLNRIGQAARIAVFRTSGVDGAYLAALDNANSETQHQNLTQRFNMKSYPDRKALLQWIRSQSEADQVAANYASEPTRRSDALSGNLCIEAGKLIPFLKRIASYLKLPYDDLTSFHLQAYFRRHKIYPINWWLVTPKQIESGGPATTNHDLSTGLRAGIRPMGFIPAHLFAKPWAGFSVLTYRWSEPLARVLAHIPRSEQYVWLDIMCIDQNAGPDIVATLKLAENAYRTANDHFVCNVSVFDRAWCLLELFVRMESVSSASKESSRLQFSLSERTHLLKTSLSRFDPTPGSATDFFARMTASVPSDAAAIRARVLEKFTPSQFNRALYSVAKSTLHQQEATHAGVGDAWRDLFWGCGLLLGVIDPSGRIPQYKPKRQPQDIPDVDSVMQQIDKILALPSSHRFDAQRTVQQSEAEQWFEKR